MCREESGRELLEATRDACVAAGCLLRAALGTAPLCKFKHFQWTGEAPSPLGQPQKNASKYYVIVTALAAAQI